MAYDKYETQYFHISSKNGITLAQAGEKSSLIKAHLDVGYLGGSIDQMP